MAAADTGTGREATKRAESNQLRDWLQAFAGQHQPQLHLIQTPAKAADDVVVRQRQKEQVNGGGLECRYRAGCSLAGGALVALPHMLQRRRQAGHEPVAAAVVSLDRLQSNAHHLPRAFKPSHLGEEALPKDTGETRLLVDSIQQPALCRSMA